MIFEIINPSDFYTIEGDDFSVCCAACLLLGKGFYSLEQLDAGPQEKAREMPLFVLNGGDALPWFKEQSGHELGGFIENNKGRIADCLDSVLIGSRQEYNETLKLIEDREKREMFREEWHNRRRTSSNNIGGKAHRIAKGLRETVNA